MASKPSSSTASSPASATTTPATSPGASSAARTTIGGEPMTPANKVAIVTGASRGIGKAIALHLALAGYDIAVAARSVEGASGGLPGTIDETCARARELGRQAVAVRCDLGHREDLDH